MLVELTKIQLHYLDFLVAEEVTEEPEYVNQAEAFRRFKRSNVERWVEECNGNDKITCTLWVNDAPYADANSAGQINVGIDIINAICKKKEITAPIFVDNAESINNIIPAISQVINLKVSKNKNLEISHV